jgi:EAL domain-containing protein (putative c-di-GMP-specific phosphodiesterase class I)
VRVARRLNLRTVAEHVHNESVHARLREMGVVYMQGDLFGRALPIAAMFERFPDCENTQQHTRHGAAQAQAADRVG